MLKKITLLILLLLLCACQKPEEEPQEDIREEYIDPVRDVFIFEKLDPNLRVRIKKANGNNDFKNYQFKILGKEVYDGEVKDINGNTVNLKDYDRFILEVASIDCSHCRKQLSIISKLTQDSNIKLIQYFNVGTAEEVKEMYKEEGVSLNDEIIVIARDESFKNYINDTLKLKNYPTYLSCDKGIITFNTIGELNEESYPEFCDIGFVNPLKDSDLIDKDGNDLHTLNRSIEDVKSDLSKENQKKLEELDNDDYTEELTLKLMGKEPDLTTKSESSNDLYYSEVSDFKEYEEDKLVLIYTYLRDNSETDKVLFINDLMEGYEDLKFVVVLVEGFESSSAALRNMNIRFNCPVVSVLGNLPEDLFNFGLAAYPTTLFVDKGTFTGAYSNVESKEKFDTAIELFLSENCIAYKRNNQISNG
ncbi:MAG: hypothetical protein IK151_04755 [Erysipelotrichaceae bacterium]|nr:hypothetical protein [Erysipelotrichaceae bacterium]